MKEKGPGHHDKEADNKPQYIGENRKKGGTERKKTKAKEWKRWFVHAEDESQRVRTPWGGKRRRTLKRKKTGTLALFDRAAAPRKDPVRLRNPQLGGGKNKWNLLFKQSKKEA